jgi:hypothetical protein
MTRLVDARAEFTIDRERLLTFMKHDAKEFTHQSMADAICKAFCGPRGLAKGLNPLQLDIHRQQHLELAKLIFASSTD